MMMYEKQWVEILWAIVIAVSPEKKERSVKGDWCNSAKDSSMVKSVFSLEHKDEKTMNSPTYLG